MKKIIAFFLACFCSVAPAAKAGDGYKKIEVVATSSSTFRTPEGSTIRIYNNDLMQNETYVILIDTLNDNEVLDYYGLETAELMCYN